MKIFINPGHDIALDPGAVNLNTGLREADVCLTIGQKLQAYLEHVGYETRLLQDDDLNYVCKNANEWGADLFVSIHCNSFANPDANGIETLHYPNSANSIRLAACIQDQLVSELELTDRGVKERADLGVLRLTAIPAVLVETAFISNPDEEQILASTEGQDRIAAAIARGVTDYHT